MPFHFQEHTTMSKVIETPKVSTTIKRLAVMLASERLRGREWRLRHQRLPAPSAVS